jgi:hypothetical protein
MCSSAEARDKNPICRVFDVIGVGSSLNRCIPRSFCDVVNVELSLFGNRIPPVGDSGIIGGATLKAGSLDQHLSRVTGRAWSAFDQPLVEIKMFTK